MPEILTPDFRSLGGNHLRCRNHLADGVGWVVADRHDVPSQLGVETPHSLEKMRQPVGQRERNWEAGGPVDEREPAAELGRVQLLQEALGLLDDGIIGGRVGKADPEQRTGGGGGDRGGGDLVDGHWGLLLANARTMQSRGKFRLQGRNRQCCADTRDLAYLLNSPTCILQPVLSSSLS